MLIWVYICGEPVSVLSVIQLRCQSGSERGVGVAHLRRSAPWSPCSAAPAPSAPAQPLSSPAPPAVWSGWPGQRPQSPGGWGKSCILQQGCLKPGGRDHPGCHEMSYRIKTVLPHKLIMWNRYLGLLLYRMKLVGWTVCHSVYAVCLILRVHKPKRSRALLHNTVMPFPTVKISGSWIGSVQGSWIQGAE